MIIISGTIAGAYVCLSLGAVGFSWLMARGSFKQGYDDAIRQHAKRLQAIEVSILGSRYYAVAHCQNDEFEAIYKRVTAIMPEADVYWCSINNNNEGNKDLKLGTIKIDIVKSDRELDRGHIRLWTHTFNHLYVGSGKKIQFFDNDNVNLMFNSIFGVNLINQYGINHQGLIDLMDMPQDSHNDISDSHDNPHDSHNVIQQQIASMENMFDNAFTKTGVVMTTQDYINQYLEEFTSDDVINITMQNIKKAPDILYKNIQSIRSAR